MPRPGLRSRSLARVKVRTPGNKNVTHYRRRRPKKARCSICKRPLQAIPRLVPSKMKNTKKSSRKASRPESGRYCAKCLQTLVRESIWSSQ